ncbi:MAG: hypothetical protein D6729_03910 [Deltaproteobacteria bacterium]|nr:MAG: hypothetical protein D6729_03910 [Deltaproteobacteria bacterium]
MLRDRFLAGLARLTTHHPRRVLAAAVLLTLASAYLAAGLQLELSIGKQLPEDAPERRLLEYANENFGGMDLLFVVIRGTKDRERLAAAADRAAEALSKIEGYVAQVFHSVDLSFFRDRALLYSRPKDLRALLERLDGGGSGARALRALFSASRLGTLLGAAGTLMESEIVESEGIAEGDSQEAVRWLDALLALVEDAAGERPPEAHDVLGDLFQERDAHAALEDAAWVGRGERSPVVGDRLYFFSPRRDAVLLFVRPTRQDYDYGFSEQMLARVEAAMNEALAGTGLTWEATGNLAVMYEENQVITRDMALTSTVALAGILGLFFLFFRRLGFLLVAGVPLALSVVWTFGFVRLAFGSFNIVTAIFAPILLGLGIDFSIHLLSRWLEERRGGADSATAARRAVTVTGRGLLTGGLTTASAFLAMTIASYRGMSQMGWVAGVGILLEFAAMITLVPALLTLFGDRLLGAGVQASWGTMFSDWLSVRVMRHPRAVLFAAAVISALAAFSVTKVRFNYDMREIDPQDMPSIVAMKRLEQEFGMSVDYGMVLADDQEEERRRVQALEQKATVGKVDSSLVYLPRSQEETLDLARQLLDRLQATEQGRGEAEAPAQGAQPSEGAVEGEGLRRLARAARAVVQTAVLAGEFEVEDRARALAEKAEALAARFEASGPTQRAREIARHIVAERERMRRATRAAIEAGGLDVDDLPESIRQSYVGRDGRRLIYAYPRENLWDERFMGRHVAELKEVGGDDVLGIALLFHALITGVMEDFGKASLLSLLAVIAFLLLDFRHLGRVLLALIPLAAGALWMLGLLPPLGIRLDYVNIAMVPIILGIGIDDGVHMLHRYLDDRASGASRQAAIRDMAHHTGHAVLLTTLTTAVGFGSIGLAEHNGLKGLGITVGLGILACYLASVTLLPALLALRSAASDAGEER